MTPRILLLSGVSIADQASLISALSGLHVVQLVRGAMRQADMTVAGQSHAISTVREARRRELHCEDHRCCEPAHKSEHSAVHPRVKVVVKNEAEGDRFETCRPQPVSCAWETEARPASQAITLQAPWKVLPWPEHMKVHEHFKKCAPQPDIQNKGMLIDLFV